MPIKELKSYSVITAEHELEEDDSRGTVPKTNVSYSTKKDEVSLNFGELKIKTSPILMRTYLWNLLEAVNRRVPEEEPEHKGPIDVADIAEDASSESDPKVPVTPHVGESEVPNIVKTIAFSSMMRKKLRSSQTDICTGIRSIQKRKSDFDFIKVSDELKEMGESAKVLFVKEIADMAIKNAESDLQNPAPANQTTVVHGSSGRY